MNDRLNTIFGWVLFSGIVALGLSILSDMYFHGSKHERPETMGYPIAGVEAEGGAEQGPDLATLLANGDPKAGEKVFQKCTSCHTIEQGGANGIGPNLYAVLGQHIGKHAPGFAYSSALSSHGGEWTYENIDAWLKSPRAFASGTKMSFAGLSKPEDRANVILYLREHGGGPPLPEPKAPAAEENAGAGDDQAEGGESGETGEEAAQEASAEG